MVDNRGNAYRTRAALTAGIALIGLAVAILGYFALDLGALPSVGIFVLAVGLGILLLSPGYSGTPDKFGPSEMDFRLVGGTLIAAVGFLLILTLCNLEWYVYVVVFIIVVAILGMLMAVRNSRKINNE